MAATAAVVDVGRDSPRIAQGSGFGARFKEVRAVARVRIGVDGGLADSDRALYGRVGEIAACGRTGEAGGRAGDPKRLPPLTPADGRLGDNRKGDPESDGGRSGDEGGVRVGVACLDNSRDI